MVGRCHREGARAHFFQAKYTVVFRDPVAWRQALGARSWLSLMHPGEVPERLIDLGSSTYRILGFVRKKKDELAKQQGLVLRTNAVDGLRQPSVELLEGARRFRLAAPFPGQDQWLMLVADLFKWAPPSKLAGGGPGDQRFRRWGGLFHATVPMDAACFASTSHRSLPAPSARSMAR